MAIDWNKLQIKVIDDDNIPITDDYKYTMSSEQRMVIFAGRRGEQGPAGPVGPAGPAGPSGSSSWGNIDGDIENQTDLANALALKANVADLSDLAYEDDAPSDNAEYVRKNGAWAVSSGGISSVTWGDIEGSLSDQTDLQTALDTKAPAYIGNGSELSGQYIIIPTGEELSRFKATYNVTQSGTGTPSADNVRPFVSASNCNVCSGRNDGGIELVSSSSITLSSVIYGGVIDVMNGIVTVTHGYIASYNGETLTGRWYSDRDEYIAGMTPSIGAEVVYELATPVQQTCQSITPYIFPSRLNRDTYLWATAASSQSYSNTPYTVDGIYGTFADIKTYIDQGDAVKANVADLGDLAYEDDAPSDNAEYVRKNGSWAVSSGGGGGGGTPTWGSITGTMSQQTDLQTALDAKANTADLGALADNDTVNYETEVTNKPSLGTMSAVNDAPSDSKEYVRKNGVWAEKSSDSVSWGDVSGTLSDQTDLQSALDTKADEADLGALASKDTVDYATEVTNKPSAFPPTAHTHDDRYYTESEVDALLADKADTSDLGDLATLDSIDYTSNKLTNKPTLGAMASQSDAPSDSKEYVRKNGAWAENSGITSVAWGDVTGTLADQTDLANALNGKQNTLTFDSAPTAGSTNPVESGGVKTALDAKQDTLTFDSTPTASSTNPVTSGGVKSYVDSHEDFKVTGTVSSSGYTLTDSRINDEHWEVDWIQFTTSSHVMTGVNWTTNIVNHKVTLSATYSGSTNVVVNMHWVQ